MLSRAGRIPGGIGVSLSVALVYAALMQSAYETPPPAPDGLTSVVPAYSDEDLSSGDSYWGFAHFYPRFGLQHRSQGYGYNAGYTSLDAFVPLYQDDEHWLTGFQGNVLLDNGGDFGTNLGLLTRQYRDDWDRIFGINSFYTHRQQDGQPYHQMGIGVETLGDRLDWRMNAYFPFGTEVRRAKNTYVTSAVFSGRDVLVNYLANKALAGFDTEIGGPLPASLDIVRAYIGLYHFRGEQSDSFVGVQGRLEARLNQNLHLHGGITNDKTFGTNVVFGISLWLPGYNPPTSSVYGPVADRLGEDVWRNQNIVIEQSPLRTPVPAIWSNGLRVDVVHVDSAAAPGGDGSFLAPVQTLTQAQAAGLPGSIIYARANSTYTGEGIVLQDQQQLLGEGIAHTVQSGYGPFQLPTITPPANVLSVPILQNAPGDAVTVANQTVVSGFRILNSTGDAINGVNVTDVTVDRTDMRFSGGDGVDLTGAQGVLTVTENFATNNAGHGISIDTAVSGSTNRITVSENTVLQNNGIGINVVTRGQSLNTLVMEENLVRVSLGPTDTRAIPLVQIETHDSAALNGRVEDNDFQDYYARDTALSPTEDPYYHQVTVNTFNNSRMDIGFISNRLESDRRFLLDSANNGSFGLDLNSTDVSGLRARIQSNTSSLNYALSENFISVFQVEDTLTTNTGTFFYFPTANFIDVIPANTLQLP